MGENRKMTAVEWAAEQMATLDAAGYGMIMMRCSQESDIRRVIAKYIFRQNQARAKYPCVDSPKTHVTQFSENMLEVTALGTVRRFEEPFSWQQHGYDAQNQPPYAAKQSLITVLTSCTGRATRMTHRLIYIPGVYMLSDGEKSAEPEKLQYRILLKDIARLKRQGETNALVVIGCTDGQLCQELIGDSYILDIPYPDIEEIAQIIRTVCAECDGGTVSLSASRINALAEVMRGLREDDIRRIFHLAFASDEAPTAGNAMKLFEAARNAKKQMIAGVTGLKWLDTGNIEMGGLGTLRKWLEGKKWIFQYPRIAQLQKAIPPKGVLLCGLPGCGKTTLARFTAQLLGEEGAPLPLVQMDIAQFKGKYLGESEANCEIALRTVESVAPCVLLIDEIEKIFGGVGGDGAHETTMHIFSAILDWMQKRRGKPVFVIATANKTEKLPSEFKRKGRFDEIFFVGVPCEAECREIFRVHLDKKCDVIESAQWNEKREEIISTVLKTAAQQERFLIGADIESIVDAAFCELFVEQMKELKQSELAEIDGLTEPFVRYSADAVKDMLVRNLLETRSYFDNNMADTALYWLDMYQRQFREAGGDNAAILPAQKECFDGKTMMFDAKRLKKLGMLSDADLLPQEKNEKIEPDAYEAWLQAQLEKAHGGKKPEEYSLDEQDYDGVFRWRLAQEIFRCGRK